MAESVLKLDTCSGRKEEMLGIRFGFIILKQISSDNLWITPHPRFHTLWLEIKS